MNALWTAPPLDLPQDIADKLRRFKNYPKGWAFGEGDSFDAATIAGAKAMAAIGNDLRGFDGIDVFPGRNGQIVVTFYQGEAVHDFAVRGDRVEYCKEAPGAAELGEAPLSFKEALKVVFTLGMPQCPWSDFLLLTNTKRGKEDSRVRLSSRGKILDPSRSLTKTARVEPRKAFAHTPSGTIVRRSKPTQPSFTSGVLIKRSSPPTPGWNRREAIAATTAIETS